MNSLQLLRGFILSLGVPPGGATGQVLAKASNADQDTAWVDQSGGGGGGVTWSGTLDTTNISHSSGNTGITGIDEIIFLSGNGLLIDASTTGTFTATGLKKIILAGSFTDGVSAIYSESMTVCDLSDLEEIEVQNAGVDYAVNIFSSTITDFNFSSIKRIAARTGGSPQVFINGDLTQAQVDGILAVLAAQDGTSGTTIWNGTVTLVGTSAPPSAAGLVSKGIIEGRGGTVNVNS